MMEKRLFEISLFFQALFNLFKAMLQLKFLFLHFMENLEEPGYVSTRLKHCCSKVLDYFVLIL